MTSMSETNTPSLAEVAMDAQSSGGMLTIIPHDHDVLCGRGGLTNHHKGNAWYRKLVSCNRPLYRSSPKHTKLLVSKAIVQAVHSQTPPGRFLERNQKSGLWHPVPYKKAVDKTSQALREKDRVVDGEHGVINVKIPATYVPNDKSSSLHDLARAAVERAGGMPDYSTLAPSANTRALSPAAAPPLPAPVPSAAPASEVPPMPKPPMRTTSSMRSETIKSHMSIYCVQALQSAGGLPMNWCNTNNASQHPNRASIAAAAAAQINPFAAPVSSFAMPSMLPPAAVRQTSSVVSNSDVATTAATLPNKPPPGKRSREGSTGASGKLARNHRKLPTKKRRIEQEVDSVPPLTEPLQDRASSMFRFFEENQLLPSQQKERKERGSPSDPASLTSSSTNSGDEDTPLTMLMQVATSELVEKPDGSKNDATANACNGQAQAQAPALSRVTSQVSDWLKAPFWPVSPHMENTPQQPPLAPGVSSTLLKLAPSRLLSGFSSFFERQQALQSQASPQRASPPSLSPQKPSPQQQIGRSSTGKSLLDDYEESAMEAQLRTVPSKMPPSDQ